MVEAYRNGADTGYWGYLIKPDKSAAPHLEQLCLGLARIICSLEPGPHERLTPRRLATFYRSVGGDLDAMFLRTSESGLSFLYRTIGCFHSLEPSKNPFETPSLPCLTPEGFVKWQTVQLLLCPEEHVQYLQEAVRKYNVPRPDEGMFPKTIPRESFPDKADVEMEAWHKSVTSQLNQESYARRIKNSPYHSPHPTDRADGYFSPQVPRVRRPSKPARRDSRDEEVYSSGSRRCSEPEFGTTPNPVDHARNPYVYSPDTQRRSASANRPTAGAASRQRSATTGNPVRPPHSHSTSRNSNDRPPSSYRSQYPERIGRLPSPRSPSGSSMGDSSAEDASSEDSRGQRRSTTSKAKSSFLSVLPFTTPWSKRSRSHDASSYRKPKPSPRRDDRDDTPPPLRASTENFAHRQQPSVRFREDMFDGQAAASAPESPAYESRPYFGPRPDPRSEPRYTRNPGLTDPVSSGNYKLTREVSSGSGSERRSVYDMNGRQLRKTQSLQRNPTVTGVQGRKYASVEKSSSGLPPGVPPGAPSQDPRLRYSLAV